MGDGMGTFGYECPGGSGQGLGTLGYECQGGAELVLARDAVVVARDFDAVVAARLLGPIVVGGQAT